MTSFVSGSMREIVSSPSFRNQAAPSPAATLPGSELDSVSETTSAFAGSIAATPLPSGSTRASSPVVSETMAAAIAAASRKRPAARIVRARRRGSRRDGGRRRAAGGVARPSVVAAVSVSSAQLL